MEAAGIDVVHLEVGRPSFDTPSHIKEATKAALDRGLVHYDEFPGSEKLRRAIAERLTRDKNISTSADEILITNGLTHAYYAVCMAGLNEGDEVILLDPHYPQHVNKIELAGAKPVFAPLDAANGYHINTDMIRPFLTERTRMIVIVNPANPTGRVFTREELQCLADLAIEYDLLVASDEVYELIVYDGNRHTSIASLPGMAERTFSMFAFTKAYAMDGWRLGYIACARRFMPALLKITMNDIAHVNVFIQEGAYAAITGPRQVVTDMVAEDQRRRDMVYQRLNAMKGVVCPMPEGTIYAFPDVSAVSKPSAQIADEVLTQKHVITEAGTFYGSAGEGHLRICFGAESRDRIESAMDRMTDYFADQ